MSASTGKTCRRLRNGGGPPHEGSGRERGKFFLEIRFVGVDTGGDSGERRGAVVEGRGGARRQYGRSALDCVLEAWQGGDRCGGAPDCTWRRPLSGVCPDRRESGTG